MFYYKVESSHWQNILEFKSEIYLTEGQCFRIKEHDGLRSYPTRFKVLETLEFPEYSGQLVEILKVDLDVENF